MSADLSENPLLKVSPHQYLSPDFPVIKLEHFKPAILEGMRVQLVKIGEITANTDEPSFENTILALELSNDLYHHARNILGNLSGSDTNDEIMALDDEISPLDSNHSDDIYLNTQLFQRVEAVYNKLNEDKVEYAKKFNLTSEDVRLIEETYQSFILAGAKLNEEEKAKMREYNELLSSLENKFAQNLVKIMQSDGVVVNDVAQLEGLTADEIDAAAAFAKERGLEGKYVLQLVNTTRNPLLCNIKNRQLRKQLFDCSTSRGFKGDYEQTEIVYQILTTRAKVAELLQFKNYAAYHTSNQMAKTPENALAMLTSTIPNVMKNVKRESDAILQRLQRDHGADAAVEAHDWEFYAEIVRSEEYNVDPNILREYFEFNNVLENGVFYLFNQLYGVTFKRRDDIPTQHDNKDIVVYEVFDHDNTSLALFHADYFKRSSKNGGAWMSEWVSTNGQRQQKSVTINNMNIVKAAHGKPTFLTLDEVSTVFHELGHGFHAMFSTAKHRSLAGTNTSTDYVEFPSTVCEDWSIYPSVLDNYAKHYKTGEAIKPDELQRVIKASKFNQGFETLEYVTAALIDLEWHSLTFAELTAHFAKFPTKAEAIQQFEIDTLQKHGALSTIVPPRYKTQYFNHSMTSYSASYYAYLWSELIAADAFRYITEFAPTPGPNRENGDKLRKECYATGNTRDLMTGYVAFRGQEPTSDALLLRRGLCVDQQ